MRIETMYLRWDAGREAHLPCSKERAESTAFVFSAFHPVDGHEFGLMYRVTEVLDGPTMPILKLAQLALDKYLADNPDGESGNKSDPEEVE